MQTALWMKGNMNVLLWGRIFKLNIIDELLYIEIQVRNYRFDLISLQES